MRLRASGAGPAEAAACSDPELMSLVVSGRSWLAVQVRARHEKAVGETLRVKGYEDFVPLYRCQRQWSDRVTSIQLPLFSGYVFCRPLTRVASLIVATRGVLRLVGEVPDSEIAALKAIVASGLPAEPWAFLQTGQQVRLQAGPLSGLEGILMSFTKQQRVVVSVTLLQRSVAIEIQREWVTPRMLAHPSLGRPVANAS